MLISYELICKFKQSNTKVVSFNIQAFNMDFSFGCF